MKIGGFTFVRNAVKYDYPILESINSILPLCDTLLVSAGNSSDTTDQLLSTLKDDRIVITKSVWDDNLRSGGKVLADETNKAFDQLPDDCDWIIYIQADEVMHEAWHAPLRAAMLKHLDDDRVEGLLLKYRHFYGTYDYIADSRKWYSREIRVIRNDKKIRSYKDAQGFRKEGRKLNVKEVDAYIYHYGWVKDPVFQKAKEKDFHKLWHDDEWVQKNVSESELFDYSKIDSLEHFKGKHPSVMQHRVNERKWNLNFDPSVKRISLKNRLLSAVERLTGYRPFEYKNYTLLR